MSDLQDNDYQQFICVETANVANNSICIEAGKQFQLDTEYNLIK